MAQKRSNRKGQVLKEAFYKGQRTSEREHQSMVWLHAGMDDQDKSIICVDTLVCCLSKVRGCVGSNTSPGHGSMVPATIRQACTSCVYLYCLIIVIMSGQHSVVADQVAL